LVQSALWRAGEDFEEGKKKRERREVKKELRRR